MAQMRVTITGIMTTEDQPGGGGGGTGIWGPTDPRPNPPIFWPGYPGQPPPGWGGPGGGGGGPQPEPPRPGWPGMPGGQPIPGWPGSSLPPILGFWGPTDPRPSQPIQLPPWAGGWQPGIWGPNDPRPTPPISGLPGLPGYEPPTGGGGGGGGGIATQPIAGQPGPGGMFVFYWSPAFGWVAVPAAGPIGGGPGQPPQLPEEPPTNGGGEPPPEPEQAPQKRR
jgi:hypothetical protein